MRYLIAICATLIVFGCTPKVVTHTSVKVDTLRLESIKEVTVLEHVIDSASFDSLLIEYSNLKNAILTSDTRIIYKERERIIKEEIIKSILPDSIYKFTVPFKMSSPDSTFDAELIIDIEFKGGKITHTASSIPVAIPYVSETRTVSIERLNAWSKWLILFVVVLILISIKKFFF